MSVWRRVRRCHDSRQSRAVRAEGAGREGAGAVNKTEGRGVGVGRDWGMGEVNEVTDQ